MERVCSGCKFTFYGDISASKVQRHLAEKRNGGNGLSHQTSNFYLQAIKQFCRWMVRDGRAVESPVDHLSGLNVKLDRRHDRRSLTATELSKLLEATATGSVHHKLGGEARALLYRVAMETGLRRSELRSLTPACLELDADPPVIVLAPQNVKNRKPTVQVIRPELAAELRTWLGNAQLAQESPLWANLTQHTSKMLKADLEAAGIAYVDDAGRFADFHALRHSFVSLITQGGVHPKIAQRLARHSTVELTLGRYSHTLLSDEAAALDTLPSLPSMFDAPASKQQVMRSTGTDGREIVLPPGLPERGAPECTSMHATAAEEGQVTLPFAPDAEAQTARKTRQKPHFRAGETSGEAGIRTLGRVNPSPVFKTGAIGRSATSPGCGGGFAAAISPATCSTSSCRPTSRSSGCLRPR